MRIQETDRVLKEARIARHAANAVENGGVQTRTWIAGIAALLALAGVVAYFRTR